MIGDTVTVKVDRPLGSRHPNYSGTIYSVNYGYVEEIRSPDGEEQDAYILGIDTPVDKFTGIIIAIIHRYDDIEEKWVVAPKEVFFSKREIEEQVAFVEQYFKHELIFDEPSNISEA